MKSRASSNSASDGSAFQTLRRRYATLGFTIALADASGHVQRDLLGHEGMSGALFDQGVAFVHSLQPLFADPAAHDQPREVCPGLWVIVTPCRMRRRIAGFLVAVTASRELTRNKESLERLRQWNVDVERLCAICEPLDPPSRDALRATAASLQWSTEDLTRIDIGSDEIRSLGVQLSDVYEELSLLHKVGESMNVAAHPERFMRLICRELLGVLPYRWVGVKLLDDQGASHQLAGMFIAEGEIGGRNGEVSAIVTEYLRAVQPMTPKVISDSSKNDSAPLSKLGRTLILYPLTRGTRVIGAVIACDKQGGDGQITSVDVKLIATTASQLQVFLENVGLYEDVQLMFLGTLEALSAAIDAKDPYTCGHSERVALLSRDIARAIGMSEHEVERIHISGLVHDVGKIGIAESVLCKPGKLTDSEFELMKQHPRIGARILKDIPHFSDILPGVLYHHERFDGRGYPDGLVGRDIPMFGRIIAIADSFDAMSSTRTYRAARSRAAAIEEIRRCAGTQFDPEFARVFVNLDFSDYDALAAGHRIRYSAGTEAAA